MRRVYNKQADVKVLIERLRRLFEKQGYDAKPVSTDILEIKKSSTPRKIAGLSSGLRIAVTVKRDQTTVDLSGHIEEYTLKAIVIAVSLLQIMLLFPLTAAGSYGLYQEYKLIKAALEEIDDYFNDLIVS